MDQLILPYDPEWPALFRQLEVVLTGAFSGLPARIHHVGSTAVPGLAAKPIIDIDVEVAPDLPLHEVIVRLEGIGYRHHGDQGIAGREVFKPVADDERRPAPVREIRHHLYVCPAGSRELRRHLAFRDALRADDRLRDEYAALKQKIAAEAGQDRKRYAALKEAAARSFVERVLATSRPD